MKTESAGASTGSPKRRPLSIASRLTITYTLATVVLLITTATLIRTVLVRGLLEQDTAMLASKLKVLRALIAEDVRTPGVLESEVEHESGKDQPLRFFIRLLAPDGSVLIESRGFPTGLTPGAFPGPIPLSDEAIRGIGPVRDESREHLLASGDVPGDSGGVIQVALDTSMNQKLMEAAQRRLIAVLFGGVLSAALIGWLVARRAIAPLGRIARMMHRVSASTLGERLSEKRWPAELGELADEFDQLLGRLEDSFSRLSQCSADMAHGLRNPINNLRGEAEVALASERSAGEYREVIESSLEELARLSRMIDGLLFIARADNPATVIERISFQVRGEIDEVVEFYDALAEESGVTVVVEGEGEIKGEPMLVRRAVSNLLANALKHTPSGGQICIEVSGSADDSTTVKVRDNGSGIPHEHLSRVFDRFYQVGKSKADISKGAGLGLTVVQAVMQLHKGTASIESEPGKGTVVTLVFPRD